MPASARQTCSRSSSHSSDTKTAPKAAATNNQAHTRQAGRSFLDIRSGELGGGVQRGISLEWERVAVPSN
jgi:hypothetical protein